MSDSPVMDGYDFPCCDYSFEFSSELSRLVG